MLLTVKKQVEETIELKIPAYYKDGQDDYHHINEAGQLITIRRTMVCIWSPEDGHYYTAAVEDVLRRGKPCTKEEFEKAYAATISKLEIAAGAVHL